VDLLGLGVSWIPFFTERAGRQQHSTAQHDTVLSPGASPYFVPPNVVLSPSRFVDILP
jgi:hypothetical protein